MKNKRLPILALLLTSLNSFGRHQICPLFIVAKEIGGQLFQQYNKSENITDTNGRIVYRDTDKYIIKGNVYDSTLKQGLVDASVIINHRNISCTTDEQGNFKLNLPQKFLRKNFNLFAYYVGYKPTKVKIKIITLQSLRATCFRNLNRRKS